MQINKSTRLSMDLSDSHHFEPKGEALGIIGVLQSAQSWILGAKRVLGGLRGKGAIRRLTVRFVGNLLK